MMHKLALGLALAVLAGCAGAPPAVSLSDSWPERPGSFEDTTRRWTRHGTVRAGSDLILDLQATLKSPAWRAAHVEAVASQQKLPAAARAELVAEERALAERGYEVTLAVATHYREHNDLQKGERSMWRVALVAEDGRQIVASSIERDRRPRQVIASELPELRDFAEVYVARFPRSVPLFGDDVDKVGLIVSSNLGTVDLRWQSP